MPASDPFEDFSDVAEITLGLAETADLEAVPHLARAAADLDVRRQASVSLCGLAFSRHASAVEAIAGGQRDAEWSVRETAAEALGRVGMAEGAEASAEVLITALGDATWQVRQKALRSLGRLNVRRAVPIVVMAFSEEMAGLRKEAAAALGEIADPAARAGLEGT